jgi:predicted Rdx family selenoprotein
VKAWIEAKGHGPVEITAGKSGQFDIEVDGNLAYSRYSTGRFPSDAELEKLPF